MAGYEGEFNGGVGGYAGEYVGLNTTKVGMRVFKGK